MWKHSIRALRNACRWRRKQFRSVIHYQTVAAISRIVIVEVIAESTQTKVDHTRSKPGGMVRPRLVKRYIELFVCPHPHRGRYISPERTHQ